MRERASTLRVDAMGAAAGLLILAMAEAPAAAQPATPAAGPTPEPSAAASAPGATPGTSAPAPPAPTSEPRASTSAPASVPAPVATSPEGDDERPEAEPALPYFEDPMLFLERTHFGIGWLRWRFDEDPDAEQPILFEGTPALHVYLLNQLNQHTAIKPTNEAHYRYPFAVSLTFNPAVRMLAEYSEPVRTPSWKVRLNVQYFIVAHEVQTPLHATVTGFRASFGHYSNGQEGCSFGEPVEPSRDQAGLLLPSITRPPHRCVGFDYDAPDVTLVNRVNGDFSMNHFTLAAHHRWVALRPLGDRAHMPEHSSSTLGAQLDLFVSDQEGGGVMGGISDDLRKLYGDGLVRVEFRSERTLGVDLAFDNFFRLSGEAFYEYVFGENVVNPHALGLEASFTLPNANDLGLFASLFIGRDYYNILFVDRIYQLMLGVTLDLYSRPRYACPGDDDRICQ